MLLEASGKTSESGEEVEKFKKCGKEAQNARNIKQLPHT